MASPSLHAATRRGNVAISCETLLGFVQLARFTTRGTLKNPSLSKYRTFSPVEQGWREFSLSLSGSKLFTTAAVYARLDIYLQRERNGAAVSETAEQPSGNKEAVGDELYPKNRGALCASARYSCFLGVVPGNATVIPSRSSSRIFSIPL